MYEWISSPRSQKAILYYMSREGKGKFIGQRDKSLRPVIGIQDGCKQHREVRDTRDRR